MTSISAVPARPVLADLLPRSIVTDIALVVGGAGLTAALAQVDIPLKYVDITGQTLAVLLVGASLGAARGAASMVLYAVVGALGAPIFADHHAGAAQILGSSGGYIVGFIPAAALTGWLAQHRWERTLWRGMLSFVAGSGVVFLIGLPWLKVVAGLDWPTTLSYGLYPFVIGGIIKAAIAAVVLKGAWSLVARADRSKRLDR